jgi:hypothetical protein
MQEVNKLRKSLGIEDFIPNERERVKDFICEICRRVLTDPLGDSCGHAFCLSCYLAYPGSSDSLCPISHQKTTIQQMDYVLNKLSEKYVYCSNRHDGCQWEGRLGELSAHIGKDCMKQVVECVFKRCSLRIFREQQSFHSIICDFRDYKCEYCSEIISYLDKLEHYDQCGRYLIVCPKNCGTYVERKGMDSHLASECNLCVITCPYIGVGCQTSIFKKDLSEHLLQNMDKHSIMHYKHYTNNTVFISEVKNDIMKAKTDFEGAQRFFTEHIQNMYKSVNLLTEEVMNMKQANEAESKLLHERLYLQNNMIEELQKILNLHSDEIKQVNTANQELDIKISGLKDTVHTSTKIKVNGSYRTSTKRARTESDEADYTKIFDTEFLSDKFVLCGNSAIYGTKENDHTFLLLNQPLTETCSWTIRFNESKWLAIGCCVKEAIVAKSLKFHIFSNHGAFLLSTNGYLWNCNKKEENDAQVKIGLNKTDNEAKMKYSFKDKELHFYFNKKFVTKLTNVYAPPGSTLVPCIVFNYSGDEIIAEL